MLELQLGERLKAKRKSLETIEVSRLLLGGDKRDRTADLLNAIQALSQLSYTPMCSEALDFTGFPGYSVFCFFSFLRGRIPECLRSQLSYTPIYWKFIDFT